MMISKSEVHRVHIGKEILDERQRQIKKEGFKLSEDDNYIEGELGRAAVCYALAGSITHLADRKGLVDAGSGYGHAINMMIYWIWPRGWDWHWWKPTDRRRDLIKAGALIVAEIERLDRVQR